MANLTRIKNNQITDSTIWANAKIIPGSIVGSLFNSNITVTSDFTITGNLTVQGAATYMTVASTNTYVNDPLIVLNNAFSGTNTYDLGFIFNRGSSTNQSFYWDESSTEFKLIATSETGTTYGSIAAETSYSNLHLGNIIVQYDASVKTLTASSTINTTGNILSTGAIHNALTVNGATNISTLTVGNINVGGGGFNSNATVYAANFNTPGNVLASTVYAQLLTADDLTVGNVAAGFIGNTGTAYTGASINLSGNVLAAGAVFNALTVNGATGISGNLIAGLAQFAAINSTPIGNATAASGAFTSLSASATLYANASTATTAANIGALIIPTGGFYVGGAANVGYQLTVKDATQLNSTLTVGGITSITNTTNSSEKTGASGALQVDGGASIAKDVYIGGNLYVSNIFATTQQTLVVSDPLVYFDAANTYPYNYDIGFYSNFVGPDPVSGTGNVYQHTGLIRDNADYTWKFVSNVRSEPDGGMPIDSGTIYDPVKAGNLVLTYTQAATSTTTGALQVAGGAGIAGTVVAGAFNTAGNVLATAIIGTSLNVSGNVSATELNTGTVKATGLINTTGNVSAATVIAGQINTTGNVSASEISTATVKATGLINTTGNVSAATVIAGQFNTTGNLVASQVSTGTLNATGLINTLGNISASRINADVYAATGIIWANSATDTTSLSDGALVVTGGTAIGKTLWVGEGARINSTQSSESFRVLGQGGSTNNSLLYVDSAKNAIVFGGANIAVQDGAVAKFNSTGAIVVPVGTSAQRPGAAGNVDVAGMVRFSTTTNNLEFYDGSAWQAAGSAFTIITTNSFNGDGSTTGFTLSTSSTTAGTYVAINGVVQIPVTAYSVSGTTLTFTEAPASGDVIDARVLITTATVSALANGNGYDTFDVSSQTYANITAGTSSAVVRMSIDGATGTATFTNDVVINGNLTVKGGSSGNINIGDQTTDKVQLQGTIVYNQTAIAAQGTNLQQIDSFSTAAYSTAKYLFQIKDGANIESGEILLAQDTANISLTTYAVIAPAGTLGTFSCNIVSGSAKLWYTPTISTYANIKVQTTYIV